MLHRSAEVGEKELVPYVSLMFRKFVFINEIFEVTHKIDKKNTKRFRYVIDLFSTI